MTDSARTEALIASKTLIAKEENWCQGAMMRVVGGIVQYCSLGALNHITKNDDDEVLRACRLLIHNPIYDSWRAGDLVGFNDHHTHEEVMQYWDQVIAESRQLDQLIMRR